MDKEYFIITPTEITGLKVTPIIIAIGIIILSLSNTFHFPDEVNLFALIFMIGFSAVGFIMFGIMASISYKEHSPYRKIRKIVVSDEGIAFVNRDGIVEGLISWMNIKKVEIHVLISKLMVALIETNIETNREPISLKLYLVDNRAIPIPLQQVLKKPDRASIVSYISRHLAFQNIQFIKK